MTALRNLWIRTTGDAMHGAVSALTLLRHQVDHAFRAARWQVRDLTDDEYLWEPCRPCWSVRRRSETAWPNVWGKGEFVVEDVGSLAGGERPRVTTIAWKVAHLAGWLSVYRAWTFDGTRDLPLDEMEVPGTAARAALWLQAAQDSFGARLGEITEAELPVERVTFFDERRTVLNLVWGMAVEHYHHSAEIGCLRDIRRGYANTEWWPEDSDLREP